LIVVPVLQDQFHYVRICLRDYLKHISADELATVSDVSFVGPKPPAIHDDRRPFEKNSFQRTVFDKKATQ
jgi:hypothetical protein